MNEFLKQYVVAVEHPEVSAFEHLNMLMIRDKLADLEPSLTFDEKRRLRAADQKLLKHAAVFQAELARITDLEHERQHRQPPPQHWWWYLDVLTSLPTAPVTTPKLVPA